MLPSGTPRFWEQAKFELGSVDPTLDCIITSANGDNLIGLGDPFFTLVRSIVGQQISVKAADSIWLRLEGKVGSIVPENVGSCSIDNLKAAGLTWRKAEYIRDIAIAFGQNKIFQHSWLYESDKKVITELCKTRGIGNWTAQMFLIFCLLRPNILPLSDIGLQRACERHYSIRDKSQIPALARKWSPWCSVATWYLWHSLDATLVAY